MDTINDQEDIKQIKSKGKLSLASILHELKEEKQIQASGQSKMDEQDLCMAQGWVEGLEFAIKLIEEHNGK